MVGSVLVVVDVEICVMLLVVFEYVGIQCGDYLICINNCKVLNGIFEVMGVFEGLVLDDVLCIIDKFDKVGCDGVCQFLIMGCKDDSGVEIVGVGFVFDQVELVIVFLILKGVDNVEMLVNLCVVIGVLVIGVEGVDELVQIVDMLQVMGVGFDQVIIDFLIVCGFGYYIGLVFEVELIFEIFDEKGCKCQFGSVVGGGCYDGLVECFIGQKVFVIGILIGVDCLLVVLCVKGLMGGEVQGLVVVIVMDCDCMGEYQVMVVELCVVGICVEVYLGNFKNFGNQLKYVDKCGFFVVIIQGGDEVDCGVVQVKDLILGVKIVV